MRKRADDGRALSPGPPLVVAPALSLLAALTLLLLAAAPCPQAGAPASAPASEQACARGGEQMRGDGDRCADPPREEPVMRVGGCQTSEREYGLAAMTDSAAAAAVNELIAPGEGPKGGAACERLGVDAPLFAQIGTVGALADSEWVAVAKALGVLMDSCGLVLAERSLLRHTIGPCFPPYHIDLRACGRTEQVARFLARLAEGPYGPFTPAARREERRLFVSAGRNMSLMNTVVDLK